MKEQLKAFGGYLIGIAMMVVFFIVISLLLFGMMWLVTKLLPLVTFLSLLGVVVAVPCLFLSFFPSARGFSGNAIYLVSWVWGLALWMWATLVLYQIWGVTGLFLGLVLLGFGSVPLACVAELFHGDFAGLFGLILSVVFVFGARFLGIWILSKKPGNQLYMTADYY